jgi:hypothetical protein
LLWELPQACWFCGQCIFQCSPHGLQCSNSVPCLQRHGMGCRWRILSGGRTWACPGHAYLGESAIYSPFSTRNRCEAEGGGIVWEFLLLRSGACVHKGGVGTFASQSWGARGQGKWGNNLLRVWFIHFFLKAFSYWSALKSEFVFVVNGKRECVWYCHACIVGITYHTLNSRNTFIIMKKKLFSCMTTTTCTYVLHRLV